MHESDGSIIIDSELNSEGFKSGSKELKAAIISLINEIRNFGQDIKSVFENSEAAIRGSSETTREYEGRIVRTSDEVERLKAQISEMQSTAKTSLKPDVDISKAKEKTRELKRSLSSISNSDELEKPLADLEAKIEKLKNRKLVCQIDYKKLVAAEMEIGRLQQAYDSLVKRLDYAENFPEEAKTLGWNVAEMYAEADTLEDYIREKMKAYEMLKNFEKQHQSNPSDKWSTKDEEKLARASQKYNDLVAVYNDLIAKEREAASAASDYGSKMSAFFSSAEKIGFLNAAVSSLRNNLLNTSASIANLTSAGGTFYSMFSQIHPAIGAFGGLVLTAGTGVARLTGGIAKLVGQGLLKLGKIGAKVAVSGLKKFGSAMKSVVSRLNPFKKSAGGAGSAISKLGKKITGLGSMLKRMILRKIMQSMIQGVKDGLNNLAQCSDGVNGNLSTLKSGLTQLKNSLATAFAPILTVITPILSKLIGTLSEAITKVGQFFAALTGKKTFTKAVKVQEDYAASLDNSSKSSDKAAKASKKYGDALDIDEVHDIQSKNDSDSTSSSGGVSPSEMFEEVAVDSKISEFAQKLKDAIRKGDFDGMGKLIGNSLNSIVSKVNNFATKFKWQEITASIAKGANGLVSGVNWKQLGHTIGNLINVPIQALYGFVTTFNWVNLGESLGNGIMSLVETVDWAKAAKGLSNAVIGIITFITNTIETIDWQVVGNKIAEFLGNINWGGILSAIAEGIGAVLGGLAALLWGLIEDAWNDAVQWWRDAAYEDGEFTIEGLFDGILNACANIRQWIYEHIFQPFINGFKKAFKIHSPSKVMEEMGRFIVDGLKKGVVGLATVGLDKINSLVSSMQEKFSNLKNKAITWGKDIVTNLSNGIKNGVNTVGSAVTKVADKIKAIIGFSEPDEGPLSNFHTYMPDMLKLMADGIRGNKGIALEAVSSLAGDMSKRLQSGEYTLSHIGFESEAGAAMNDFADTIVDGFADMLSRMQVIAENVTFTVPQVVTGIIPYSPSYGGSFPKNEREEFLSELFEMFKEFISSVRPYDNGDNWKNIKLEAELNVDGQRLGRIVAKPAYDEDVRSGRIRINAAEGE